MNRPVHFEIHVAEPEKSQAFYEQVFGWKFQKWDGPEEYWLLTTGTDGPGINGGLMRSPDGQPRTVNTVQVSSVDEYVRKVTDGGGRLGSFRIE